MCGWGFSRTAQPCISVQRVSVHQDVYDAFIDNFVQRVAQLRIGDPLDEMTDSSH